jgi:hypothetical protein
MATTATIVAAPRLHLSHACDDEPFSLSDFFERGI